jgi:hypothetical protein
MLAPPSNGSAVSRQLLRTPGVRWLYRAVCGPAAVQLGAPRHHIDARCVRGCVELQRGARNEGARLLPRTPPGAVERGGV